jgi:predicted  nucleic acid-binding Zn-ribbon protein
MADEQLKFVVGADTSQFNAELKKAENELRQFQNALKKTTDINELEILNGKIQKTQQTIAGLNNSMKSVAPSTNKATQSLTDLSRVVQDAPYGFIGIANNINPLVESFSRLKAESGSTGGALKALLSGLSGPAGLGIAFAVVTSAITFAQVGFQAWTRGSKEAKEQTMLFADQLNELDARFKNLKDSIKNSNDELAFQQKVSVIRFDIKNTDDYARSINSLKTQFETLGTEFDNTSQSIKDYQQASLDAQTIVYQLQSAEGDHTKELERANKVLNEANSNYDTAVKKLGEIGLQRVLVTEQLKLEKVNQDKLNAAKLREIETIDKVLAKLREDTRDQRSLAITFNTSTLQEQANLVKAAITKLITVFNVDPNNKIIIKLQADLADLNMQIRRENQIAPITIPFKLNSKDVKLPKNIKIEKIELPSLENIQTSTNLANLFSFLPANFFKPFNQSTLDEISKTFNQGFESIAEDTAILFGQTLGDALTGQASIGDFFKGIFASLGANLEALGKFLVKTAIEIELIQKTLFTNPFLAIAGGIALIAIGRAISNATNRNAFATGTRYAPGGMALVGERGPEMINLPRGSQVIPAAQTSQMMGGIGGAIEVFGMLRGQDIFFSNRKYGQTYKRTT